MIKKEYSLNEWEAREDYYAQTIMGLVIPALPNTKEIMELTSKLDCIYTEAAFEYAQIKRKEEMVSMDLKNAEAEMFSTIKQQQLTAGTKVTEADIKGRFSAVKNLKVESVDIIMREDGVCKGFAYYLIILFYN